MRIRSTKPEFWRSKTIAALPWDVRLVLKGLESYVDDNGVGKDDIALIAADVFPRDLSAKPRDTLARLSEAISQLSGGGLVTRYEVGGEDLLYVERWKDLQRIDKPGRGRFPRPDGTTEYHEAVIRENYGSPRETVGSPPEVSAPGAVEQWNRGTEEQGAATRPATRVAASDPDGFTGFWAVYPKRVAKGAALTAYKKALKKTSSEALILGAKRYAAAVAGNDARYTANPASWLNAERWDDEPATPQAAPRTGSTVWDRPVRREDQS